VIFSGGSLGCCISQAASFRPCPAGQGALLARPAGSETLDWLQWRLLCMHPPPSSLVLAWARNARAAAASCSARRRSAACSSASSPSVRANMRVSSFSGISVVVALHRQMGGRAHRGMGGRAHRGMGGRAMDCGVWRVWREGGARAGNRYWQAPFCMITLFCAHDRAITHLSSPAMLPCSWMICSRYLRRSSALVCPSKKPPAARRRHDKQAGGGGVCAMDWEPASQCASRPLPPASRCHAAARPGGCAPGGQYTRHRPGRTHP
jgi:hypothetical protein